MIKLTKKEWVGVAVGLAIITLLIIIPSFDFPLMGAIFNTESSDNLPVEYDGELYVQDLTIGEGPLVKAGDELTVHYTGSLQDGTVFDSSLGGGTPFAFTIGNGEVIEGWDVGLLGMRKGGKRLLVIPPDMGYGDVTRGPIPANSILIFDIELIDIKDEE